MRKRSFIHNRLRKHRRISTLQQKQVARLLNHKTTARLSRWEKGMAMPSVENLFKLSVIYRCFPNDLYFELYLEIKHHIEEKEKKKRAK